MKLPTLATLLAIVLAVFISTDGKPSAPNSKHAQPASKGTRQPDKIRVSSPNKKALLVFSTIGHAQKLERIYKGQTKIVYRGEEFADILGPLDQPKNWSPDSKYLVVWHITHSLENPNANDQQELLILQAEPDSAEAGDFVMFVSRDDKDLADPYNFAGWKQDGRHTMLIRSASDKVEEALPKK